MMSVGGNRFATLVDARGFAKLDENKYKRRRNYFDDNNEEQKYLIVQRIDENKSFNGVSPFLIEKGLSMITTNIKETQRLRNGELLILTSNTDGYNKLLKATKLATINIKVEEHKTLNTTKGVIYCRDLMTLKEEEITKELQSQKVVKVERIKRKVNNELLETPLHIVTFNTTELPVQIKAGFLRLDVRMYFPNPMRCHTCQRYGHTKTRCERVPVCPKCAKNIPNGHDQIQCQPICCVNCKTEHTTFDKKCPTFQREKEIIKIKTIERITYYRAKELYYRQNANTTGASTTGQSKPTYSEALQQNKADTSTNNKNNSTNTNNNKQISNNETAKQNNNDKNINNKENIEKNNKQNKTNNNIKLNNNNTEETTEIGKTNNEISSTKTTTTNIEQAPCCTSNTEKQTTMTTATNQEGRTTKRYTFLNPAELQIALDTDHVMK